MMLLIKEIIDWAEVWTVLIPLFILLKHNKQPRNFKPVIIYLWVALFLNTAADVIWKRAKLHLFLSVDNNNPIYNTHSIIRLLLFSWFFNTLDQSFLKPLKQILPFVFLLFVFINFMYYDNYFDRKISFRLYSLEAGILLIYCLQYYFSLLLSKHETFVTDLSSFWIVTGLSIFVIVGLPVYVFYNTLLINHVEFAKKIWLAPKISFAVFCILISQAFAIQKNE